MSLLDAAAGSATTAVIGCIVWAARKFVWENSRGPKGDTGDRGEKGSPGDSWTVKEFNCLADLLIDRFNGRYLLAKDARLMFQRVYDKIDALHNSGDRDN
jgi:hypothetical protein